MARTNSYEAMAARAAERIEKQRDLGEQMTFLPDEAVAGGEQPTRGKAKAQNQMREYLASKGYRAPEEVLVQMAGMASRDDAVTVAIANTERLLAHAFADATDKDGNPVKATPAQFINAFQSFYTVQLRALDALMPYGAPKAQPDVGEGLVIPVMTVPAAPNSAEPAALARDVTPQITGMIVPADVREEVQQNQGLGDHGAEVSDA